MTGNIWFKTLKSTNGSWSWRRVGDRQITDSFSGGSTFSFCSETCKLLAVLYAGAGFGTRFSVPWLFHVLSLPCLAFYGSVLFCDGERITQQVPRMVALELIISMFGTFFWKVSHGFRKRYHGGCIQQDCEGRGMLVSQNMRIWTFLMAYRIVRLLDCFDESPVQDLHALARSYKDSFDAEGGLELFPYRFNDSLVTWAPVCEGVNQESASTQAYVQVS